LNELHGVKLGLELKSMFGNAVTEKALESQVRLIENSRSRDQLGIIKGTGILAPAWANASIIPVKKNTFFGG
jgi:hypothetical protein